VSLKATRWQEHTMRDKRSVTGLIVTVATASAIMAGPTAVTSDIYHDMNINTTASDIRITASAADTLLTASPDIYHDMAPDIYHDM
jgi:hypothetical protein